MTKTLATAAGALTIAVTIGVVGASVERGLQTGGGRQAGPPAPEPGQPRMAPAPPLYTLDDGYLQWALPVSEQAYAPIDGKHLKQHVLDLTAISRRYRDQGHQLWGRIQGTDGDAETAKWVADKFEKAGLEVRVQMQDLPPEFFFDSWDVAASGYGKTVKLASAQPAGRSATPTEGIDVEAVYVGLGTEADFAGRDVKGKAVFIYSIPQPGPWQQSAQWNGAAARAEARGAAAVFTTLGLPGNIRWTFGGGAASVPSFGLGSADGDAVRELIEKAPAGQPPHVKLRLATKVVPGLKTAIVWGTLPGTTEEKVMIVAHRDGYFEAAGDNASGVAVMVGLAEYFARIPKEKRRRTIEFVGTPGHHGTNVGTAWMAQHQDKVFAKTALLINCEHVALNQLQYFGPTLQKSNTMAPMPWFVGGSARLGQIVTKAYSTFGVPTFAIPATRPAGEMGTIFTNAPSLQVIDVGYLYHTDAETADMVPPTGLQAIARSWAKVIDEVNKLEIKDLVIAHSSNNQP